MTDYIIKFHEKEYEIKKEFLKETVGEKKAKILYEGTLEIVELLKKISDEYGIGHGWEKEDYDEIKVMIEGIYLKYMQELKRIDNQSEFSRSEAKKLREEAYQRLIGVGTEEDAKLPISFMFRDKHSRGTNHLKELCKKAVSLHTIWNILHRYGVIEAFRVDVDVLRGKSALASPHKYFYAYLRGERDAGVLDVISEIENSGAEPDKKNLRIIKSGDIEKNIVSVVNSGKGIIYVNIQLLAYYGHSVTLDIHYGGEDKGNISIMMSGFWSEHGGRDIPPRLSEIGFSTRMNESEKEGHVVFTGESFFDAKKGLNGLLTKILDILLFANTKKK